LRFTASLESEENETEFVKVVKIDVGWLHFCAAVCTVYALLFMIYLWL